MADDRTDTAIVHSCCGCSCWVCARSHQAGPHTDECGRRHEEEQKHGSDAKGDHVMTATMCPFVTVTPTIQSGTVVRWFTHEVRMETCHPTVSASRDSVTVHNAEIRTSADMNRFLRLLGFAHDVQGVILNDGDVSHLATHEREGFIWGEYLPVDSGSSREADRG